MDDSGKDKILNNHVKIMGYPKQMKKETGFISHTIN